MQIKFRGFPNISSTLTTIPLILMDSCFPAPQTRESSNPTTLQFPSWSNLSDVTSHISLNQISVLEMEPFVGLGVLTQVQS